MSKNNSDNDQKVVSFKAPEPRFPQAAVSYIDALLSVQRDQFERSLSAQNFAEDLSLPEREKAAHIFAESDEFIGAGWSELGHRRDGTSFRWMGRLGSLLLPLDFAEPRSFEIRGCGFTKRRYLKEATLWLDDKPVEFTLSRRGFNRWKFTGSFPEMEAKPYHLLRIQASGISPLAEGVEAFVSLAVSEIRVGC